MFHRNIIFRKNSFQNLTVKHKKIEKKCEKSFIFQGFSQFFLLLGIDKRFWIGYNKNT